MIVTLDGLAAGLAARAPVRVVKAALVATIGRLTWLWTAAGIPGAGTVPASSTVCTAATAGAIARANPTPPALGYYAGGAVALGAQGVVEVLDVLVMGGSLSGAVATSQTATTAALPTRGGTGEGVAAYLAIATAWGATGVTATVSYTNQAGVAGRVVTFPVAAATVVGTLYEVPRVAGDTGVRSVQTLQLSATTGAAGAAGFVLALPVAAVCVSSANVPADAPPLTSLAPVLDDACLVLAVRPAGASTGALSASLRLIDG